MKDTESTPGVASAAPVRLALGVEYQGHHYHGWQRQKNDSVDTVQAKVEKALSIIANEPISIICAGRTDAGVSGCNQVIHFDTHAHRDERAWVLGTNAKLPDDIAIRWAKPVSQDFHARFSATGRRYRYVIYCSPMRPALLARGVTWTYLPLDVSKMQEAAKHLVGEHNFNAYRAVQCQAKSPVRTVKHLKVTQVGQLIVIDVAANAFLHHMVRNFAGVLMAIGAGEQPPSWAKEVLDSQDRRCGGVTARPEGLYFVDVEYPEDFELPDYPIGPYFIPGLD